MQVLFCSKRVRLDKCESWFWMIHVWILHFSYTLTYMYIPEQQTNYNSFGGNVLGIEVETISIIQFLYFQQCVFLMNCNNLQKLIMTKSLPV